MSLLENRVAETFKFLQENNRGDRKDFNVKRLGSRRMSHGGRENPGANYCEAATRRAAVSSLSRIMPLVSTSGKTIGSSFFAG